MEPFGVGQEGRVQGGGPLGVDLDRGAVVHGCRSVHSDTGMTMFVIVILEELVAKDARVFDGPNVPGNAGQYLSVLNCASEYGLSLDTRGRERDWSIPGSASRPETVFEVIEVPRSA